MRVETENKNWKELLHCWLNGEARREDERSLDALAKDDPFLSEALEGYRSAPEEDHAARIASLKANLQRRTSKRRGVGFYMLRIAAIGAVLMAAWFAFMQFGAQNREETATAYVQDTVQDRANESSADALMEEAPEDEEVAESNSLHEKTTAKSSRSKAPAPVAEAPAPPEENLSVSPQLGAEQIADKAIAPPKEIFSQASGPEGGFEKFEKYLKENLRRPAAAVQAGLSGAVSVRFRIQADGRPTDFEITKSLGGGYDEEAIRLLKEGPIWEGVRDTIAEYTFEF